MSDVSYWPALRTDRAKHCGVVDYELLQEVAADKKTGALVINDWDVHVMIRGTTTVPVGASETQSRAEAVLSLFPRSAGEYRLARVFPGRGHWGGDYMVFLRND